MKTNIKLRVTPEQSEAVQKICFANGAEWLTFNSSISFIDKEYLFIESNRIWCRGITDHTKGIETEGYTEVDPDLFIRTNGTCIESTEALADECNFAKYGFEKPNFECELFGTVSDHFRKNSFVIGVVKKGLFNNCPHMWSVKNGTCYTSSLSSNMPEYNLTPIKKPWYETCKFPVLVWDIFANKLEIATKYTNNVLYLLSDIRDFSEVRPLTNSEIDQLKQDF